MCMKCVVKKLGLLFYSITCCCWCSCCHNDAVSAEPISWWCACASRQPCRVSSTTWRCSLWWSVASTGHVGRCSGTARESSNGRWMYAAGRKQTAAQLADWRSAEMTSRCSVTSLMTLLQMLVGVDCMTRLISALDSPASTSRLSALNGKNILPSRTVHECDRTGIASRFFLLQLFSSFRYRYFFFFSFSNFRLIAFP